MNNVCPYNNTQLFDAIDLDDLEVLYAPSRTRCHETGPVYLWSFSCLIFLGDVLLCSGFPLAFPVFFFWLNIPHRFQSA